MLCNSHEGVDITTTGFFFFLFEEIVAENFGSFPNSTHLSKLRRHNKHYFSILDKTLWCHFKRLNIYYSDNHTCYPSLKMFFKLLCLCRHFLLDLYFPNLCLGDKVTSFQGCSIFHWFLSPSRTHNLVEDIHVHIVSPKLDTCFRYKTKESYQFYLGLCKKTIKSTINLNWALKKRWEVCQVNDMWYGI